MRLEVERVGANCTSCEVKFVTRAGTAVRTVHFHRPLARPLQQLAAQQNKSEPGSVGHTARPTFFLFPAQMADKDYEGTFEENSEDSDGNPRPTGVLKFGRFETIKYIDINIVNE